MACPLRHLPQISPSQHNTIGGVEVVARPDTVCLQHQHSPVRVSQLVMFIICALPHSRYQTRHNAVHFSLLSQVAYFKNGSHEPDSRKQALRVLFPELTLVEDPAHPCRDQKEFFAVDVSACSLGCFFLALVSMSTTQHFTLPPPPLFHRRLSTPNTHRFRDQRMQARKNTVFLPSKAPRIYIL